MRVKRDRLSSVQRLSICCTLLALCTACAKPATESVGGIDPQREAAAIAQVTRLRSEGAKVWCVPFARSASGVDIRGDARTWWQQAQRGFQRAHEPLPGAVMAFSSTRRLPLGHVAVVSKVVSDREILVDHANWNRNQVSLGMAVMDVSTNNDWSRVRVESHPHQFGSVYPVDGFILPVDSED